MELDLNRLLAESIRSADWYRLVPFFLAIYNLGVMYALEAPRSIGGRLARTVAYVAHILSAACLFYPDMWLMAFPMQMLGWCILNTQYYIECHRRGRPTAPSHLSAAGRFVKVVVGEKTASNGNHPPTLRREDVLEQQSWSGREEK